MGMYFLPTFLIVATIGSNAVVDVGVYYETLCPYSKLFIENQLAPVYETYKGQIKLDLVPHGLVTEVPLGNGTWQFICEHGPEECYGNQYHGCAVDIYSEEESLKFVTCSMSADSPVSDETLTQCAEETGLDIAVLNECYTSGKGADLLYQNGEKTSAAIPYIFFLPTIVFNSHYNQSLTDRAQTELEGVLKELIEAEQ